MTLKEGYANSAAGYSKFSLWLYFIFSISAVVGSIFLASSASSSIQMILALFYIVISGACVAVIGYMLKVKHST